MAQNKRKLTSAANLTVSNIVGKLRHITIADSGDIIYKFYNAADGSDSAKVIYQVDTSVPANHQDLDIPFTKLFCKKESGTTGDINILFE
jgi:hypothetical protein